MPDVLLDAAAQATADAAAADAATAAAKVVADKAAADAAAAGTAAADQAAAQAASAKAAADAAAAEAAKVAAAKPPEKYDLKLPKDSTLDPAIVERTAANARALGLSNEAGQKLLDSVAQEFASRDAALVSAWEPMKGESWKARDKEWKAEALADPEIGGTPEKLETSATLAKQVVEKFFDPKITEFLRSSGLGSHPEYIRGLARIGKGMAEGSLVLGASGASAKPKTTAEVLYGPDGMGPKKTAD